MTESMAAEEQREPCSDENLFSEENVEIDRLRGVEHIAKLRDAVAQQDQVYRAIMLKVCEDDDFPQRLRGSKTRGNSGDSFHKAAPYPLDDSNSLQANTACSVANRLAWKQLRDEQHLRKKGAIAAQEAQCHEALMSKHSMMDQRVAQRQHELVERQTERTFLAQQKRNEQQKMLKEIQRDQDHHFEVMQMKLHPPTASASAPKLPAVASAAPAAPLGEPELVKMNRIASEPIYRDITESHKLYNSTLERFRTVEADNDKRTEAYWRKMGATRRRETKPEARLIAFRNAAKTITTNIRTSAAELPGAANETFLERTQYSFDTTDPSANTSSDLGRSYAARRDNVQSFQEELGRQATEKRDRDKEFLEEKLRRGRSETQKIANKASEGVKAWEARNVASVARRQKLAIKNNGECDAKMAAHRDRLDNLEAQRERDRSDMAASNLQTQRAAKAGAQNYLDDVCNGFKEKQSEKDKRGNENMESILKIAENRASSGIAEKVAQMYAQKVANEEAFRNFATDEIKAKQERHMEAMKRKAKQPTEATQRDHATSMARFKLQRKDKGRDKPARAPPPELTLAQEQELTPAMFQTLKSPIAPSIDVEQGSPKSGSNGDTPIGIDVLEQQLEEAVTRRSTIARKPNSLNMSGSLGSVDKNLGASNGGNSHRSSNASEEESEGEFQFLEELRTQSSKWLQQMREDL